jgi:hypothetical protein
VGLVQPGQERRDREREGIDEQRDEPLVVELGKAHYGNPVVRPRGRGVEALDLRARKHARPDGHRGILLELANARDHSFGDAAQQVLRRELLADGLGGRLSLGQVRRGEEREREVDTGPAQRAASLPRRLPGGVPRRLRGRQTGSDPARERL